MKVYCSVHVTCLDVFLINNDSFIFNNQANQIIDQSCNLQMPLLMFQINIILLYVYYVIKCFNWHANTYDYNSQSVQ